jgi:hypothetical protein
MLGSDSKPSMKQAKLHASYLFCLLVDPEGGDKLCEMTIDFSGLHGVPQKIQLFEDTI